MTNRGRKKRGAVLGLVVVCALVLVMIIVGLFVLTMYMGGSREVRNATDSGALNVGKQMMVRVKEKSQSGTAEEQFNELQDKNGEFGIGNINRVWAKSMLVSANYQAMKSEGTDSGTANSHADSIYNSAQGISDRLADKLNTPSNLYPFFNEVAERNSVRMIGKDSDLKAHDPGNWTTSLVDRGAESNIMITAGQLPSGVTVPQTKAEGLEYVPGYQTFEVGDHTFAFVPFKVKERTHLIAGSYFSENKKDVKAINWNKPVPNGYSVDSKSLKQESLAHQALAFVQPNPQKYYDAEMRGFIRINFPGNDIQYLINGLPTRTGDYDNRPGTETEIFIPEVGTGTLTVMTSVGNEYVGTLANVVFNPLVPGNWGPSKDRLLQRCRELKHDCTMAEMLAAMAACPFVPGQDTYYIYPSNGPGSPLIATPESAIIGDAALWLKKSADADGSEKDGVTKEYMAGAPNEVTSAVAVPDPYCSCEPTPAVSLTFVQGWHDWTPGTGYDGCLGTMKIHRKTTVSVNVVCHPL